MQTPKVTLLFKLAQSSLDELKVASTPKIIDFYDDMLVQGAGHFTKKMGSRARSSFRQFYDEFRGDFKRIAVLLCKMDRAWLFEVDILREKAKPLERLAKQLENERSSASHATTDAAVTSTMTAPSGVNRAKPSTAILASPPAAPTVMTQDLIVLAEKVEALRKLITLAVSGASNQMWTASVAAPAPPAPPAVPATAFTIPRPLNQTWTAPTAAPAPPAPTPSVTSSPPAAPSPPPSPIHSKSNPAVVVIKKRPSSTPLEELQAMATSSHILEYPTGAVGPHIRWHFPSETKLILFVMTDTRTKCDLELVAEFSKSIKLRLTSTVPKFEHLFEKQTAEIYVSAMFVAYRKGGPCTQDLELIAPHPVTSFQNLGSFSCPEGPVWVWSLQLLGK